MQMSPQPYRSGKYGKLVRLAPHVVSVSDPDEIANIYKTKGNYTKSALYPIQSIVWQREVRLNLFSTRTFDVIGELTFGEKLGFLDAASDIKGMMSTIEVILAYSAWIGQIPEAHPWLLGNPLLPYRIPSMKTLNEVVVFTLQALAKRTRTSSKSAAIELREGDPGGDDMLSRWTTARAAVGSNTNTADMITFLTSNVFAGSDATAIALRATLYYLMHNPDKLAKLVDELVSAQQSSKLSNPIQDKEARALPYLNAVLTEARRLHPSVGLIMERHVPAGAATICGQHIPENTIVGINPWVVHYNHAVFPESEDFQPERWLESSTERLAAMNRSLLGFGAGSRACIGRNISMVEMRKVMPQLLSEFEIGFADSEKTEWRVKNRWFTQQEMPLVRLKRRSKVV